MPTADEIISALNLEKHVEGGYYRRTYTSAIKSNPKDPESHSYMSSIYYLLTVDSSLSYFVSNKSDLILYYHSGAPLKIIFLHKSGEIEEKILGPNVLVGETPQVLCPANINKAYQMLDGDYSLISEAVCPEFKFADMHMPSIEQVLAESNFTKEQLQAYLSLFYK